MANPYLAFALLIYAGLYGIENNLNLPLVTDMNLYTADKKVLNNLKKLPESLDEAKKIALKSEFVNKYLSKMLINTYCKD